MRVRRASIDRGQERAFPEKLQPGSCRHGACLADIGDLALQARMSVAHVRGPLPSELVRLVGGQGGVHACMSGLRMAVPLLALQLGHGAAAAGLLVALFGVAQLLTSIPAGRLADRHGLKRPMYFGVVAAFLGAAVAAAFPVFPGLCAAALLEGSAIALVVIALQRHAGRMARDADELRRLFSWISFTPAAANFLGPFVAGLAIDGLGYRAAFLLLSLGPLIGWAFVRGASEVPAHAEPAADAEGSVGLWRNPAVRRVLLMNWFVSATWDVHGVMVPLLGHARGLDASSIGGILGAFAIAAAAVRLLVPWLSARTREWALMAAALALAGVLLALYPLMRSAPTMGACSMLIGLAVGGVQPMVMSMLHQITPAHQHGQAIALRLLMINASSISMPLLAGAAGGVLGAAGVFWAMSASLLVGVRVALGMRRTPMPPTH